MLDFVSFVEKLRTSDNYWKIAHSGDCPFSSFSSEDGFDALCVTCDFY